MTPDEADFLRRQLDALEAGLQLVREGVQNLMRFAQAPGVEPPRPRNQTQQDMLDALTDRPVNSKLLARLSGHSYSSWFRRNLADLVDRGLVRRLGRRYYRL